MKAKHAVCLATAVIMTASMAAVFAGCGEEKVAVKWYDGTKVLQTTKVTKGEKAEKWTPEKDGYIFVNWYSESSLTDVSDFDTKIEKDTNIFAGWRSATVEKDMRIWYAIGSGAGTMKASNWQFATTPDRNEENEVIYDDDGYATFTPVTGKESVIFKKAEDSNTFTLELTLYGGDIFRFATGKINSSDWSGDASNAEVGIGALEGFAYADGFNPNDKVDVTADSKQYGEVKNAAGDVVFYGGSENGHLETSYWNLWVADGMDGIYTFTMTTYPGEDANNTITWTRKGDAPVIEETHKMFFVGTIGEDPDSWSAPAAGTEATYLDKQKDGTFKGYITITEDNYASWAEKGTKAALKLKNEVSGIDYGINGTKDNFLVDAGTWCFTFNPENDEIKYEKCDYYVVGTLRDGTQNVSFENIKTDFAKMTSTDGVTYTYDLVVEDMSKVDGYTWLADKGEGQYIFAMKVAFGAGVGGAKDWFNPSQENNPLGDTNCYLTETGTYTVTFNATTGAWTIEKAE